MTKEIDHKTSERTKYETMWGIERYRKYSPGERLVDYFLSRVNVTDKHVVIDFGCGSGRAASKINRITGATVLGLDIATNCLDPDIKGLTLIECCLWEEVPRGDVGYCTDVMEHIPPEHIDAVLTNIRDSIDGETFFQICTQPAGFGKDQDLTLHMTVRGGSWWMRKLEQYFKVKSWSEGNTGFTCIAKSKD